MSIAELKGIAASLDEEDRAELAGFLLDLMDGADPGETTMDSVTEALSRRADLEAGTVVPLSESEFWNGLGQGT